MKWILLFIFFYSSSSMADWVISAGGGVSSPKRHQTNSFDPVADCTSRLNDLYADRNPKHINISASKIETDRSYNGTITGYYATCTFQLYVYQDYSCAVDETVEYPNNECIENIDKSCSSDFMNKEIQNEQYICQTANPNTSFYESAFQWSCSDNEITGISSVSTSCNYDKKDCIQGLTCESESQPETPICNPENEDCSLPPETPLEEIPEESTNPDDLNSNPNPCELGVDLCNNSDTPFTDDPNQNPDSSSVSDNPNLSEGDNALYKEAVITNHHLENMNHKMKEFVTNYDSKSDQNNKLYKAQLGQQTEMNKKLGQQLAGTTQINKHLDNIENELNKSFCDKNPEHPDCAKTPFGDLPDFTQSNHFATVFDSSKFAELSQKKDDLTQQIQDKINQFKTDLNITPSFSGGSYTDENITLSGRWGTVTTSNSYWSDNSSLISTAIVALCSLVAFSIVIVRRR